MFVQVWNKYLPVIRILLKRSASGEQKLEMNETDFRRAAAGKKVKFIFSVLLVNGKTVNAPTLSPITKDLISVLQEDETVLRFMRRHEMEFSMNNNFQLLIKNNSQPQAETDTDKEDSEIIETETDSPSISSSE